MPITQSAKKALRQSARRRTQNLSRKEAYKAVVKNIRSLIASGKPKDAQALLSKAYQALDKASKAHVIKKNKAARLKSRVTRLVQKAVAK